MRGLALVGVVGMLSLAGSASSPASVTIGQLAPAGAPSLCANSQIQEYMQPSVTSGNSYVVPTIGGVTDWTVSSWSHTAAPDAGQSLKVKFFRNVAGQNYRAIAQDIPRALALGVVNTFTPVSPLRVKAGDILGSADGNGVPNACFFVVLGETYLFRTGDLADGQAGDFGAGGDDRINIAAVLDPTNTFALGDIDRNKKKGTARLTVEGLPNPGQLVLSGKGVKRRSADVAPGDATLRIRAKGKKLRRLNETGKVKVKPNVTFTPTGGNPSTQPRKLKLRETS